MRNPKCPLTSLVSDEDPGRQWDLGDGFRALTTPCVLRIVVTPEKWEDCLGGDYLFFQPRYCCVNVWFLISCQCHFLVPHQSLPW